MYFNKIILLLSCIMGLSNFSLSAKDDYKGEIGILGGFSSYLGDANKQLFFNPYPSYGGFFRYKFNPRIALRLDFLNTGLAGKFSKETTMYTLNKKLYTGGVVGEFNFFNLEKNNLTRDSKQFSPYIFAGIGGMTGVYGGQRIPELCIPFGVGVKLNMGGRWNLNIIWSHKLLLADNMEQNVSPEFLSDLNNPNNLNGTNIFNNDLLSSLNVGLSLDILKAPCKCNNSHTSKGNRHR